MTQWYVEKRGAGWCHMFCWPSRQIVEVVVRVWTVLGKHRSWQIKQSNTYQIRLLMIKTKSFKLWDREIRRAEDFFFWVSKQKATHKVQFIAAAAAVFGRHSLQLNQQILFFYPLMLRALKLKCQKYFFLRSFLDRVACNETKFMLCKCFFVLPCLSLDRVWMLVLFFLLLICQLQVLMTLCHDLDSPFSLLFF